MSPALRSMFEEAADDGGRPIGIDLATVRTAGRRATWRHRAMVGGSGLGAAAVVTAIALIVSSPTAAPFGPAGPGGTSPANEVTSQALPGGEIEGRLAPLTDALVAGGYVPELDGQLVGVGGSGGGALGTSMMFASLAVLSGDQVGQAAVAEFKDMAILGGQDDPSQPDYVEPCAIPVPPMHDNPDFWTSCELQSDGSHWFAAADGAIGVTMVRADGSGISVSLSTNSFSDDPGFNPPSLDELPLTYAQLVDVITALDLNAPLFDVGDDSPLPPGEPGGHCESVPNGYNCDWVADGTGIDSTPLRDALAGLGINAQDTGGLGSGGAGSELDSASSIQIELANDAGQRGSAAIEVATSVAAALMDGSGPWCAVTPAYDQSFTWQHADDPTVGCSDGDLVEGQPMVFVHQEAGADAIDATLVRADGSVISVSVSQAPGLAGPDGKPADPLDTVPLDGAAILDLLTALDAANPAS